MKKIHLTFNKLFIAGALFVSFTACTKNDPTELESIAAQNLNLAEIEDDNTQLMADQAEAEGTVSALRLSSASNTADILGDCAVVTRDTISDPRKITIDFGTGCTGRNGVVRKGKIIVTHTGRYRAPGTVIHIVSENYYVNNNKVDLDRTVTNQGENTDGHLEFTIHAERTVTFSDGSTSSSIADKTREWTDGAATPEFLDDVYEVTGTGTHRSRRGILYDVTTITPLIRKVSCHQFVSGEVKIVRNGNRTRFGSINFGTGDCDDVATVTLDNGRTFEINLRH
ncbi:MAG: hypothetical protein IPM95_08465 [Sphingobacteriales bacterium]|nr:hypothetical protein [Sphingobacteriales bacterium]